MCDGCFGGGGLLFACGSGTFCCWCWVVVVVVVCTGFGAVVGAGVMVVVVVVVGVVVGDGLVDCGGGREGGGMLGMVCRWYLLATPLVLWLGLALWLWLAL